MTVAVMQTEMATAERPPTPIGNLKLSAMALGGADLAPVWNSLVERVSADPRDAAAFLDLATIAYIQGRPDDRALLQARAFELTRIYRQPGSRVHVARPLPGKYAYRIPARRLGRDA
jgi:hypothetical protein